MVVLEKIKSYSLKLYVIKNKIPIESTEKREIEGPKMNDNGNKLAVGAIQMGSAGNTDFGEIRAYSITGCTDSNFVEYNLGAIINA